MLSKAEEEKFDALSYEDKVALITPGSVWTNRETGEELVVVEFDGEHVSAVPKEVYAMRQFLGALTELAEIAESIREEDASKEVGGTSPC